MTALLALAFAAGMIAPVNPCGFALLPAWIAQTIGDARTRPLALRLAHGLRAGLALSLGFAGTLAAFGLIVSAGARTLISAAPWLGMATGVILLLLGLAMLTGLTPRLHLPAWATKPRTQEAAGAGHKTGRMVAFGIGYAAASLGCTLGVLLAVIAQAQAVASYAGLLAVFAAYAAGSATVLMLVSAGTAIAGAALGRRITGLAKHSNRIAAFILTITGAYLSWYWYPAATGGTAQANSLAVWSAAASAWISDNSTLIAALAAAVVLASALAALNRRRRLRIRQGTPPTGEGPGKAGNPTAAHQLRTTTRPRTGQARSRSWPRTPKKQWGEGTLPIFWQTRRPPIRTGWYSGIRPEVNSCRGLRAIRQEPSVPPPQ